GSVAVTVSFKNSSCIRVEVQDTGIGISDEDQKKLFQQFSQIDSSTTRRYQGSGLGLSIAQRLTKIMKGEMGVKSVEGQGSMFWFEIPYREPVGGAEIASKEVKEVAGLSVLLVDDDEINQKIIK